MYIVCLTCGSFHAKSPGGSQVVPHKYFKEKTMQKKIPLVVGIVLIVFIEIRKGHMITTR